MSALKSMALLSAGHLVHVYVNLVKDSAELVQRRVSNTRAITSQTVAEFTGSAGSVYIEILLVRSPIIHFIR